MCIFLQMNMLSVGVLEQTRSNDTTTILKCSSRAGDCNEHIQVQSMFGIMKSENNGDN